MNNDEIKNVEEKATNDEIYDLLKILKIENLSELNFTQIKSDGIHNSY